MSLFNISSYHIQIEPDLDRYIFSGVAEITVTASSPTTEVNLNVLELAIDQCLVDSGGHRQPCIYRLDPAREELLIELPEPLTGDFQLVVNYTGSINDKMAGFYRSIYTVEGRNESLAVTQFQESSARMAFPCQDHPKKKARFEVALIVDDRLTAVSNTSVREIHRLPGGKKKVCFHTTPVMSSYLVFFGVGRFEYIGDDADRRMGLIATPGLSAFGKFGLAFGRKALQFCEQYYGIDYPLDKMDLLAVPDFAFGAMENWGAITFRENLLLDFPGLTSQAGRLRICEVIAHEIAHQWFGNLVTPCDWRYLWLNESFATYFGVGVVDHYYPKWRIWEQFIYSGTQSALSRDSLLENFPIEIPGGEHVVINTSTAPLIYSKGGSILRQIEGYMGKELFRKGIKKYLDGHAYDCAASHHLWEAFEEVSGMPVTAVMQSWIEQPGHPIIEVRRDGDMLNLSQKRFAFLPHEGTQTWKIPVGVTIFAEDGSKHDENLLMDQREVQIHLGPGCRSYKLNPRQTGFYRVKYLDEDNQVNLLKHVAGKELSSEDRWGVQLDLFAQVQSGAADMGEYLNMLSSYLKEDAFLPLISIMDNLFLAYRILDRRWQVPIAATGRAFAESILNRVGWEPQAEEAHTTANLRDHILWQAAIFGLKGTEKYAASKFSAMQKGEPIHPDIQKSVLQLAALTGDREVLDWFQERAESSSSEHERLNLFNALGCFGNWDIAQAALDFTLTDVPGRNQFIPIAAAAENPYLSPSMWQWYAHHIDQLEQMHPLLYERVILAIVPLCGLYQDVGVKEFLQERLRRSDLAGDAIRLSLERLEIYTNVRKLHAAMEPPE